MIFHRHLMRHIHLFALRRRIEDAKAHFECCLTPSAIVRYRTIMNHRFIQFGDLRSATGQAALDGNFPVLAVAVNDNPVR
jgi:hypothetical protein